MQIPAELRSRLAHYGLEAVVLSGHSDLTTADGLAYGIKAVQWCADYGLPVMNTAIGGHSSQDEDESAFLANIEALADAGEEAGVDIALEIHGDIMASGARRCRCSRASPTHGSRSRTTPATASSTATSRPSTTSPR